ncbi:uncharacterized protein LOC133730929 [Rosa rugosa]|uniref:uncharacterized protein LOC133730929 n=1 Tax=Rosa rugosa TaxID=74645 RepID=UPI002B40E612|nr:uncharacterized protein LOC133730929 [Rosa rugosa]
MGFKNIYAYNLAMLAKQGWRLVSNPQSLIAQLYKARYFPHCSFWEAELGDSPSFSWRSILSGRHVLAAGVKWRIGDGVQVNIWRDKWVPNCAQYLIQKPHQIEFEFVADLIDNQSRVWIPTTINSLFSLEVAANILAIPLSRRVLPDKLRWSPEKRGNFFVKTAYWIAREKVLENALTTTSNGNPTKSFGTDFGGLEFQNTLLPMINFKEWLLDCATNLKAEVFEKLMMIIWALWRNRNSMLWESASQTTQHMLLFTMAWLEDFQRASTTIAPTVQHSKPRWKLADLGQCKLNVDGAFVPHLTKGGLGGVLRNSSGQVQAAFAHTVHHVGSLKQFELLAIRKGLDYAKSLQLQNVTIESDCLEAVQEISCSDHDLTKFGAILDDIHELMTSIHGVQILHAPRSCNTVAHRLASIAFESDQQEFWLHSAPNCILDVVQHDCNHDT